MNDDFMTTLTVIVKYDLYPFYLVAKGKLLSNGDIKTSATSFYRRESVIKVLPESEYEVQKVILQNIESEYRKKERQLRIDLLKEAGVDFVTVK